FLSCSNARSSRRCCKARSRGRAIATPRVPLLIAQIGVESIKSVQSVGLNAGLPWLISPDRLLGDTLQQPLAEHLIELKLVHVDIADMAAAGRVAARPLAQRLGEVWVVDIADRRL